MAGPLREIGTGIHASAVVGETSTVGAGVVVGPYAVVGEGVDLGPRCTLHSHAVVQGPASIGSECHLYPYCVVGTDPQDQKYGGETTSVRVGRGSLLREFVTVNRGTGAGGGETVIGEECFLMAGAHVAHDCRLGDRVVAANGCYLAGHVQVGDGVVFGGMAGVGQFVRIGRGAFVAAGAMLERDLPPFGLAAGDRARLAGPNIVGMKRWGLRDDSRRALVKAYSLLLMRDRLYVDALGEIETTLGHVPEVREMIEFMTSSRGGIAPP